MPRIHWDRKSSEYYGGLSSRRLLGTDDVENYCVYFVVLGTIRLNERSEIGWRNLSDVNNSRDFSVRESDIYGRNMLCSSEDSLQR